MRAVRCKIYEEERNLFIRHAEKIADAKMGERPMHEGKFRDMWNDGWNREFLRAMESACRIHGLSVEVPRESR